MSVDIKKEDLKLKSFLNQNNTGAITTDSIRFLTSNFKEESISTLSHLNIPPYGGFRNMTTRWILSSGASGGPSGIGIGPGSGASGDNFFILPPGSFLSANTILGGPCLLSFKFGDFVRGNSAPTPYQLILDTYISTYTRSEEFHYTIGKFGQNLGVYTSYPSFTGSTGSTGTVYFLSQFAVTGAVATFGVTGNYYNAYLGRTGLTGPTVDRLDNDEYGHTVTLRNINSTGTCTIYDVKFIPATLPLQLN